MSHPDPSKTYDDPLPSRMRPSRNDDNILKPGSSYRPHNSDLEESLESLPDLVADSLLDWRKATLQREKTEALLYLKFRVQPDRTATEIKALVNSSDERYGAGLTEAKAEANYERLYERLMSKKKLADLRTAF